MHRRDSCVTLLQEGAFKAEDFACSCWPIHDRVLSGGMHIPVSPVVLNCGHVHCGLCTIDPASSAARLHHCVPSWDVMDSCPQCHDPIFAAPTAVAQVRCSRLSMTAGPVHLASCQ